MSFHLGDWCKCVQLIISKSLRSWQNFLNFSTFERLVSIFLLGLVIPKSRASALSTLDGLDLPKTFSTTAQIFREAYNACFFHSNSNCENEKRSEHNQKLFPNRNLWASLVADAESSDSCLR